jgi:predicted DNA-binding mobile mystery protein A
MTANFLGYTFMTPETRSRARKRLDARFDGFRPIERFALPPKGWIRGIRDALGMSLRQLGERIGLTAAAVGSLEQSEAAGTISLKSLRRAAEALDCVVIYALVPKTSLTEMIDERAREIALRALGRVSHSMALEDQEVNRDLETRIQRYIASAVTDRNLWDSR